MDAKENVKALLELSDTTQDALITHIIANIEARLKVWLKQHAGLTEIPTELSFIVEELAVSRYNRIGSEGMKSESVEGRSVSFSEDDFQPYMSILETYIPSSDQTGKVMFF